MKHNHFILILLIPVFLILTACNNHKIAKVQHPIVEIQKLSHVDLTTYYASSMTLEEKDSATARLGL